ncbi:hypothetical protein like AT4G23720 [Hibiscus trionum]|uniref:Legume lectin domain-containing protein n=1 Tax=Hibiscus trionum TaxID=183268 RepID=A0A9W7ML10_HIBTR|nr:hypothetical protein like AT4G23720 [Hibiscus trionum]
MTFTLICLLLFSLGLSSYVQGLDSSSNGSLPLDTFLQDFAFRALVITHRPHTGALYKANLPTNLSGMQVSIARIRSRTLWKQGANLSSFRIPSQTVPVPHVRRLAIVYENLGNRSSQYYSISGYSLITPIVGFLVFDASNARATRLTSVSLDTMGKPISIHFPNLKYSASARCASFSSNGTINFSRMMLPNVCYTSNQGHFSVVVVARKGKQRPLHLYPWMIGVVLGFFVLVLLAAYFGFVLIKVLKTKRIQAMERQADEGEILNNRWVGSSKMPSAAVTRSQPVLENGGFP